MKVQSSFQNTTVFFRRKGGLCQNCLGAEILEFSGDVEYVCSL